MKKGGKKTWRSGPPSRSPGQAVLARLYVTEQQSYADIARRFGVTTQTVMRWLRAAGISARSVSEATSLAQTGRPLTAKQRAAVVANAAKARAAWTPEGRARSTAALVGRTPWNKGKPWTPEQRAKHMAIRATPEYREKLAASLRGSKNHLWRGGVPDEERRRLAGWVWRRRRQECYERDNWTCQDCGCRCLNAKDSRRESKRKIQAHHIVSRRDGGADDLDNLVTLCMSCHGRRDMHRPKRRE